MDIIQEHKAELEKILKVLEKCNFDQLENNDDIFYDQVVYPFKQNYEGKVEYAEGATKGVLIFKDLGFVIKIPYSMLDEYKICGASDGVETWDYCSQEVCRYSMAEDEGLQDVFLETSLLGYVFGYPIYIQPYAQIFKNMEASDISEHSYVSSDEDKEQTRSINEEYAFDDITNIWESEVLALYGKDYYIKLKSFISDVDINDLRTANIGYYNNKPVLVDYAGFYE